MVKFFFICVSNILNVYRIYNTHVGQRLILYVFHVSWGVPGDPFFIQLSGARSLKIKK
jgi:hypothetical protein